MTGTGCDNQEGCAGTDQVTGPHNVIGDYHQMLSDSMVGTADVAGTILATLAMQEEEEEKQQEPQELQSAPALAPAAPAAPASAAPAAPAAPASLSLNPADMGKILMGTGDGGDDAVLVVYNPMGTARTELVTIAIPVCAVDVTDADTGAKVPSQVTASFGIGDGTAPYYDFELHFEASQLPGLGFQRYRISPKPDGGCGGADAVTGAADSNTYVRHELRHPLKPSAAFDGIGGPAVIKEAIRRQGDVCGDPDRWERILAEVQAEMAPPQQHQQQHMQQDEFVVMENPFMKVYVDLRKGVQAVYDKATGVNRTLTHALMKYATTSPLTLLPLSPLHHPLRFWLT